MIENFQNRVPRILFSYWLIKMAATTLGETGADHFSKTLHLGYATASILFLAFFIFFLIWKLTVSRYTPVLYWLVFTSTSLAGTALCDFMDRTLGTGYAFGSAILLSSLLLVLVIWRRIEHSLSVEIILTDKAEIFYWLAFLISNTLGTAVGDYLADDLGMGFSGGATLIGGLLLVTVLFHYFTKISSILLFWIAFVLTRPFGATFGDFLTKPTIDGGVNWGTFGSSLFFLLMLVVLICRENRNQKLLEAGTNHE